MTEALRGRLQQILLSGYKDLVRVLTRRLGSEDLAGDVLHDTYLRLEAAELRSIDDPRAYIFRAAINAANDRLRSESRKLATEDVDDLFALEIADEAPGPAQVIEARSDIDALERALASLSPRRRDIFEESFVREVPHGEIARRYGVSLRTVQMELKAAVEHCAARLHREGQRQDTKINCATDQRKTSLEIEAVYSGPFTTPSRRP